MLFKALAGYPAGNAAVILSITDAKDGKICVTVMPKPRQKTEGDGAALATPLVLTGTPAELDQHFESLVGGHVSAQQSLAEQLEATVAVLAAAKQAAGSKAATAVGTSAPPARSSSPDGEDEGESGDTNGTAAAPAATAPAAASTRVVTADKAFDF